MAVTFLEVMRPDNGLDRPIHRSIISGEIEWSPFKLERANKLLQQEDWYIAGDYIPFDLVRGIDDYIYYLDEVRRTEGCEFTPVVMGVKPDVVLTGNIEGIGPAILINLEELCTAQGVTFSEYFRPKANYARRTDVDFVLPKFQRRS